MKINYSFFMKLNTIAFAGRFNELGEVVTDVYTTDGVHRVDLAPIKLIDNILMYYGSSYEGAKAGSKSILKDIHMPPLVIIVGTERFYLFPSISPTNPECIWFVLHHIDYHKSIDAKKTAVYFFNGLVLTVDISKRSFETRLNSATRYKSILEGRSLYNQTFGVEGYQIVSEMNQNYNINQHFD